MNNADMQNMMDCAPFACSAFGRMGIGRMRDRVVLVHLRDVCDITLWIVKESPISFEAVITK